MSTQLMNERICDVLTQPMTAQQIERAIARQNDPEGIGGLSWREWDCLQRDLRKMEKLGTVRRAGKRKNLIVWERCGEATPS